MTDDLDQPPRAYTTADVASQPEPTRKRMGWRGKVTLSIVTVLVVAVLGFAAYVWTALHYTYSRVIAPGSSRSFRKRDGCAKPGRARSRWRISRERSRRSSTSPCETTLLPKLITKSMGQRVDITYQQHCGVPTRCFGETEYYRDGGTAGVAVIGIAS